jgi:hypothetical protein
VAEELRVRTHADTIPQEKLSRIAKRLRNRAKWPSDPRNANYQRNQPIDVEVKPEPEPAIDDAAPVDIDSLDALRAIMVDRQASVVRRIAAAEAVLAYELAPGALARADGQPIASGAYRFLKTVAHLSSVPEGARFRALTCLAQIENARASRTDPAAIAAEREAIVQLVNSQRRNAMRMSGSWPPVGNGWLLTPEAAAKLDDDSLRQLLEPDTQA